MSKSSAETSSTTTTTTEQKDQRVTASDSAIAIGAGGLLEVNDQFSDNVLTAFNRVVDIAQDAGITAIGFAQEALKKATERASESEEREAASSNTIQTTVMILGVSGILWIALNSKTNIGKIFKG